MENIFFIPFPAFGHTVAFLGIADILKSKGYNPIFLIEAKYKDVLIENQLNFQVINSVPFALGLESRISKRKFLMEFKLRLSSKLIIRRYREFRQLYKIYSPKFIFIDSFLPSDYCLFCDFENKNMTKIVFLQTMLSTKTRFFVPSINSPYKNSEKVFVFFENIRNYIQKKVKLFVNRILFLGMDDISIVKNIIFKLTAKKAILNHKHHLYYSYKNIPEVILSPEYLDWKENRTKNNYIGLQYFERKPTAKNINYDRLDLDKKKIIYCSFGTNYDTNAELGITQFINKLILIGSKHPDLLFIISIKSELIKKIIIKSDNVIFREFINQIELLRLCDLFISHGGLNSINESIFNGKPLLIYPIDTHYDQVGNSIKTSAFGMGISGNIYKDTIQEIENNILTILNTDKFKLNIEKMRQKSNFKYSKLSIQENISQILKVKL